MIDDSSEFNPGLVQLVQFPLDVLAEVEPLGLPVGEGQADCGDSAGSQDRRETQLEILTQF